MALRSQVPQEPKLPGVYQGEVVSTRYHKGVPFVKVKLSAGSMRSDGKIYDWVTSWARIVSPMVGAIGDDAGKYGAWFSPKVGDVAVIAFEQGYKSTPICLGFCSRLGDMPTEFDNDDYTDKDREKEDREKEEINQAQMLKTLSLYFLMHQKTNHMVLDAAKIGGEPEPRIEIGENASEIGWEIALGRRLVEQFLKHTHPENNDETSAPGNLDYEEAEDYLSEFAFINKEPREDGKTTSASQDRKAISLEGILSALADFAESMCKAVTKADEFMANPVGSITTGITDGLAAAAGDLVPDFDVAEAINSSTEFLTNLGSNIETGAKGALSAWAGEGGELGNLIGGDASAALQTQIGGLNLSGVAAMVNDGANKLLEMGAAAGITETLTGLGTDILGGALDAAIGSVAQIASDTIGGAINNLIPDIPFVESALDLAAGICSGNPGQILSGIFGGIVDGINTMTGGVLTPFTNGIKAVGGGLLEGLFSKEGLPSGKELLDLALGG